MTTLFYGFTNPARIRILLTLAILYLVMGKLSIDFQAHVNLSNVGIFAAEGISLAFALHYGAWIWPGVFAGQAVLALLNGFHPVTAVEISIVNTLEIFIALAVFKKLRFDQRFENLKSIVQFALVVMLVLQPFSALLSNTLLLLHGQNTTQIFWSATFAWWFGNVMGQLLVTPFLLVLFKRHREINLSEYLMYALIYAVFLYIIEVVLGIRNPLLLFSAALPPAIYVVANKGIAHGTMMAVVAAAISSVAIVMNEGPFSTGDTIDDTINYNLFILAFLTIILTMGALFEERRLRESRLQEMIEQALKDNQEQQLLMTRQSRLAQMGEMIAMIAHQWRQPLNNLSLVNQLLIAKYKKGKLDDETIAYFKKNSKKQIELMSATIDDFRNFFKSEEQKVPFNVDEVIQTVISMTGTIFSSHGIEVVYEGEPNLRSFGFPNALAQALLNIINNAKDALHSAEGVERKIIRITTGRDRDGIAIHISDNAGGIPDKILPYIFDPYFSTKKEKNGTGLGLYMTKMIIEKQMRGRIDVFNDEEGAHFAIHLQEYTDDAE
ncbi:MAG: GHKL domain-containing protein [Epsilonproteobacteria bacterium]|nr:GHKL domain-containing protein [Campylobacterota bacterium]